MKPHRILPACTLSVLLIPGLVVFGHGAAATSAPQAKVAEVQFENQYLAQRVALEQTIGEPLPQ